MQYLLTEPPVPQTDQSCAQVNGIEHAMYIWQREREKKVTLSVGRSVGRSEKKGQGRLDPNHGSKDTTIAKESNVYFVLPSN